jgi:glycosyltransferase involved in cell wall biosynthesis
MNEFINIRVIIAGHLILPEQTIVEFKTRIIFLPKVKVKAYYNYLKEADINLAVLYKDEITNTKSELKWFEAGCFFIPSVVSNTQNYLDVIKEAEDGFIAETSEEWYTKLKALVVDKELRNKIGENVAKRIKDEYSINTLGQKLKENLNTLIDSNYPQNKKKKKKIALVNVFFPPQSLGGATRVVADNFDLLIDKYSNEYEICVFTSEIECLEPYKMNMYNYKGARVYKANILYREHMDWHPEDKNMYKLFGEFLDTEAPDKVHFHCVQRLSASIVEATRDAKIPYIITAHDAWWISDHQFLVDKNDKVYPDGHVDPYDDKVLYDNMTLDMSIERNSYLKSLLLDAQHVLTVSESFAKIYRKNGVPNIAVTKNGISSKIEWLEKETSYSSKVVCGHIGGMSAHKGYDILKKAVMKTQPKNLEFLVVDHSKEESYISNEKWGEVDVKFIGRQNQDEMVRIYTKLDVLFAPSIWPESFGLVTREASACRCWIVASNLGGIGEDVIDGKNGFVIDPKQKAIEKTLKKLDSNYKEYKELAPKANISMVEEQVETLKEYLND